MKHIVKFNQALDANNYEIKNVPFLTAIGENNQLLRCNEENKKIIIDSQGNASIEDADPILYPFVITDFWDNDWDFETESGMSWNKWCESEYNSEDLYIENNRVKWFLDDQAFVIYYKGYTVLPTEEIVINGFYTMHTT